MLRARMRTGAGPGIAFSCHDLLKQGQDKVILLIYLGIKHKE